MLQTAGVSSSSVQAPHKRGESAQLESASLYQYCLDEEQQAAPALGQEATPGFTLTDASLGLMTDATNYGVNRGALKRASHPEDMVGAAIFLASPASDFITGQTLIVDGGRQFI